MSDDNIHRQAAAFLERQLEAETPNMDADLRRSLASLGARLAEKKVEEERARQSQPQTAKILQFSLPFLGQTRAVSNSIARCALFAPVKERQHFKDYAVVGEVDGCLVEWKGEQLNQDDHDVLLQFVKMALHEPYGVDVMQPVNAVLRGLNRQNHKEQRRQLFEQADRLMSGTIRITPQGKPSYSGHLINSIVTPQDQRAEPQCRRFLSYQLNPDFAGLYNSDAYTLFDWQERVKLKGRGSEVAKWLHLWIIGNAQQYAHKVETIRHKCGSTIKTLYSFRQKLRQALDLLKDAGVITAWRIDEADLVHIERTPSPAQLEHIAKKAAAAAKKHRGKGATHVGALLPFRPPQK